jgi:hypothetical protein
MQTLAQLAQVEQALDGVVIALDKAEDDCDCDWFCFLVAVIAGVFIELVIVAVAISLAISTGGIAGVILGEALLVLGLAAGLGTEYLIMSTFTCDNVGVIGRSMKASLAGVRASIADNEAELQHALATRDVLIASINALTQELDAAYQSNAARVLDAKTLDAIQAQYNRLRQSLLTRAQAVAKLTQSAFNFERDAAVTLIRDAYYDQDRKGYTGAETLLHDLTGLDHIDLTGRTQKAIQLSQMVSLRKHSPLSFITLSATRTARFTTSWPISTVGTPAHTCSGSRKSGSRSWPETRSCLRAATFRTTASLWCALQTAKAPARWTMSAFLPSRTPISRGFATSACSVGGTSTQWPSPNSSHTSTIDGWDGCKTVNAIFSRMSAWRARG